MKFRKTMQLDIKMVSALFLLLGTAFAAPKTITSSVAFTDPSNAVLANGSIIFQLSAGANVIGGGQIVPAAIPITLTASGLIPGSTTLWANDQLQPTGTYYIVRVYNSNGLLVRGPENWILSGTSPIDLALETNVNLPDPGLGAPVLQNPSAGQMITGQGLTLSATAPLTLNGTYSTSNTGTHTGTETFSGTNFFSDINSTQMCDQFAGATADVKLNACIAALPSTGGTADARGLIGAQTIAAEVDIGNSTTKFVNLVLPCGAVWNVTISNGTSSAMKVFGGSSAVSLMCAQNNAFQLKLAAAGNVASLVTNDQTCASCSLKIHGLMLYNTLGGTVVNAMMDLSNLGNNAEVSSINIATFKTKGLWIHGGNSESIFTAINSDGSQTSGAIPCTIETTSASLETLRFFGLDCQHPGTGLNELVINGHGAGNLNQLTFVGSHFEGSNVDTTTPFVSITDAKNVAFYSPFWNSLDSGTTNWGLQISQTGANLTDAITVVNATHSNGNFINDTIRSKQVSGGGVLSYYNYAAANSTVGPMFINGTVMTETAAPSIANTGGVDTCYGDSTAHTVKCQYNGALAFPVPLTGNTAGTHSDSGFFQTASAAGCTTAGSIGGVCATPVTITWPVAFQDTNYKVTCQGSGAITNFPIMGSVTARLAANATVQTMALTAAAASFTTIECTAVHN
jgi:hypothetical protein